MIRLSSIICVALMVSNTGVYAMDEKQSGQLKIVADRDEPQAGEIFISGSFGGRHLDFLIDTGATFTSAVGVNSLQELTPIRQTKFQGIGGVQQTGDVVKVSHFKFADTTFSNLEVVRVPGGDGRKSTIGVDLFQNKKFSFLFKQKRLSFTDGIASQETSEGLETGKKGHIYLPIKLGSEVLHALWDTGAGLSLVDSSIVAKYPEKFALVKKSSGNDTTGKSLELKLYKMKSIIIGKEAFHDVLVLSADLSGIQKELGEDVRVLLGFNILVQRNWFFDMPAKRWAMTNQ